MLVISLLAILACTTEEIPVKFKEVNDSGIARFSIKNNTEQDVASFSIKLTYFSDSDQALKIDTVDYAIRDRAKAFVKAGDETFIVQKAPAGTVSAIGKVLSFETMQ